MFCISAFALAAVLSTSAPASADAAYRLWGLDTFELGTPDQRGEISYRGFESLASERRGSLTRFSAKAAYTRIDQGAKSTRHALFVQEVADDGTVRDGDDNNDPDFLTILNQPFSVELDRPSMQALAALAVPVPFDFPTPIVGASLHGELLHRPAGEIAGRQAVGLAFDAAGPMEGKLPGGSVAIVGEMRLAGQAYYDAASSILLSIEMTLEISGHLSGPGTPQPVKITYRRTIRFDPKAATVKEARP